VAHTGTAARSDLDAAAAGRPPASAWRRTAGVGQPGGVVVAGSPEARLEPGGTVATRASAGLQAGSRFSACLVCYLSRHA
jgi:hypothetical protein